MSTSPVASKVKSHFPTYFSIEDSWPKFFFAIVSLSTKKKKSSEKYTFPEKNRFFRFFLCPILFGFF